MHIVSSLLNNNIIDKQFSQPPTISTPIHYSFFDTGPFYVVSTIMTPEYTERIDKRLKLRDRIFKIV